MKCRLKGWSEASYLPASWLLGLGGTSSPPAETMLVRVTTLSSAWPPLSFLLMERLVSGDHSYTQKNIYTEHIVDGTCHAFRYKDLLYLD